MYHQVFHSEILYSAHTVYLCVCIDLEQKAIISLYSNNLLFYDRRSVFTAQYELNIYVWLRLISSLNDEVTWQESVFA